MTVEKKLEVLTDERIFSLLNDIDALALLDVKAEEEASIVKSLYIKYGELFRIIYL